MAEELLNLVVVTPVGLRLDTHCESVAAPSVAGEFGVFAGHLPLLAALRSGVIRYSIGGQMQLAAVGPGFVEAGPEKVLLLTDSFALPSDVDGDEVRAELAEAEGRLEALQTAYTGTAYDEIVRDLEWAQARLSLLARD